MNTNTYPFITVINHNDDTFYGLLKIRSKQYITLYSFHSMSFDEQKKLISLGEEWWNNSNRLLPISIYMSEEMEEYDKHVIRFNTDDVKIIGPNISLSELPSKRIKRRNITLKKKK